MAGNRHVALAAGALLSAFAAGAAPSSQLLENRDGQNAAYTGIGRLAVSLNCTAFLIRTPGTGAAYALSAGHCYSLDAQAVFAGRPAPAGARPVLFNFFADTVAAQVAAPIRGIAYATMKGSDISVIELDAAQAALASRGVRALELEPEEPVAGEPVRIVGAPASFFESREQFLRSAPCTMGTHADLLEFNWHFWNARRNDCQDVVGGMSGSPLIVARTGRVAGIVNTTTHLAFARGGDFDCYAGRPCEIGPAGQRVEEETSYSIPVAGLMECFRATGEFDLARDGCPLDRGAQLTVTRRVRNQRPGGRLDATLSGGLAFYRYKVVTAGAGDCREASHYSEPLRLADRATLDDLLPEQENRYLLCVVAGASPSADSSWQPLRHASVVIARVDATPPVRPPAYSVMDNASFHRVGFQFAPPELSGYDYKLGPAATTRCDEPGYRPYLRIPVPIPKSDGPLRLCFYAYDEADNASPALDLTVGAGAVILPGGVAHAAGFGPPGLSPGQWISIYGIDLSGHDPLLRDARGGVHSLAVGYSSPEQINARLPVDAALGDGAILVGDSAEPVRILRGSPGIFLIMTGEGGSLLAYTTGLNGVSTGELRASIGRLSLRVVSVEPQGDGVEIVTLRMPEGHGLTGRQFLQIQTDQGVESNRREVALR